MINIRWRRLRRLSPSVAPFRAATPPCFFQEKLPSAISLIFRNPAKKSTLTVEYQWKPKYCPYFSYIELGCCTDGILQQSLYFWCPTPFFFLNHFFGRYITFVKIIFLNVKLFWNVLRGKLLNKIFQISMFINIILKNVKNCPKK